VDGITELNILCQWDGITYTQLVYGLSSISIIGVQNGELN